jgi:hypothetical protein
MIDLGEPVPAYRPAARRRRVSAGGSRGQVAHGWPATV